MGTCTQHPDHNHQHKAGCGHTAIEHDGHLHHPHGGHCDDHGPVTVKS